MREEELVVRAILGISLVCNTLRRSRQGRCRCEIDVVEKAAEVVIQVESEAQRGE